MILERLKVREYKLGFISDEDLFLHVKETVEKYRFQIDLKKFNKNLIDPIKLNFDAFIYSQSIEEVVEFEIIRRVSMDKFYELVTANSSAFRNLCQILPIVLEDVINSMKKENIENTVFQELNDISPNLLQSLYLLSFGKYEGFDNFKI